MTELEGVITVLKTVSLGVIPVSMIYTNLKFGPQVHGDSFIALNTQPSIKSNTTRYLCLKRRGV